jgi:hypothetical protein
LHEVLRETPDKSQPLTDVLRASADFAWCLAAAEAVDKKRGAAATIGDYRRIAPRVGRYSFNRYHQSGGPVS